MPPSIPIADLPAEHKMLSPGLYWLLCGGRQDADLLAADFFSTALDGQSTNLICGTHALQRLLGLIAIPLPSKTDVYTFPEQKGEGTASFLKEFLAHPDRLLRFLADSRSSLTLLRSSYSDDLGKHLGSHQFYTFNHWLKEQGKTFLLVLDSPKHPEVPAESIVDKMQGCARIYRADAALLLDIIYWSSQLGIYAGLRYQLRRSGNRLECDLSADTGSGKRLSGGSDVHRTYFQKESLRGLPLLSAGWSALDSYPDMLGVAKHAQSATMVFALNSNMQVKHLASDFQRLRASGNSGLKLVVREVVSCLRYSDQKTLLLSGASFIIPESVSNQHMLLYLSSLRGLEWNRPLLQDPEALFEKQQPLDVRGVVSAERFIQKAGRIIAESMGEMTHQLMEFAVQAGVTEEMLLSQMEIRRYGDIAAFHHGKLYLLLFACPDSALRLALHKVFKLPITELFSGVRKVTDISGLEQMIISDENLLQQLDVEEKIAPIKRTEQLQPKLISLADDWSRDVN